MLYISKSIDLIVGRCLKSYASLSTRSPLSHSSPASTTGIEPQTCPPWRHRLWSSICRKLSVIHPLIPHHTHTQLLTATTYSKAGMAFWGQSHTTGLGSVWSPTHSTGLEATGARCTPKPCLRSSPQHRHPELKIIFYKYSF